MKKETKNNDFVTHSNLHNSVFTYLTSAASIIIEVKSEYETLSNDEKLRLMSSLNGWIHTEMEQILNQNK